MTRLNGNLLDMTNAPQFRKRGTVHAFLLKKAIKLVSSYEQDMVVGDWITIQDGAPRGVKAEVFVSTYEAVEGQEHVFRKCGFLRAIQMQVTFEVVSKDSPNPVSGEQGDWIAQNGDDVADRYRITADKFPLLYEPNS